VAGNSVPTRRIDSVSYADWVSTRELTYPSGRLPAQTMDGILRAFLSQASIQAREFTKGMFADKSDDNLLRSRSPYSLPYRTTFYGVITSETAREYEDPAAFAIGLTSPVWRTAAFSINAALFETLTMFVSAADEGSRIEISADDGSVLDSLIAQADDVARSGLLGVNDTLLRRLYRPRLLTRVRPLLIWVGGIVSALVVAYLVYRLGWTG
jgi:hypothetical protein